MNSTYQPEYVVVETFFTTRGFESPDWTFSVNFNFIQPISFFTATLKLTKWDYRTPGANRRTMMNLNFDFCKMFTRKNKSNFFVEFVFSFLAKFGEMPKECPVPARNYQFANLSLRNIDIPFAKLFSGRGDGMAKFTAYTKKKNVWVEFFSFNFFGGYRNV